MCLFSVDVTLFFRGSLVFSGLGTADDSQILNKKAKNNRLLSVFLK